MTNYTKSRKNALRLCKKLYAARLIDCPKGMDKTSLYNISYAIGLQVLDLCNNKCFLEDFEHLLETSDGTPKSHKERGTMTKEQLEQGKALEKYIMWVNEKLEKLTQKGGKFDVNINVSNGSEPEYVDVMAFLSNEETENIRKLILESVTRNVKNASRKFAEL